MNVRANNVRHLTTRPIKAPIPVQTKQPHFGWMCTYSSHTAVYLKVFCKHLNSFEIQQQL